MIFKGGLRKHSNLAVILLAVVAGVWAPSIPVLDLLTTPIVIFLMYISLRSIEFGEISKIIEYRPLIAGTVVSYLIIPATAFVVGPVLLRPESQLGLYIIAAVPMTAGSSIVWTKLSNGDVEVAALLAVTSIMVAPCVTPVILLMLTGSVIELSIRKIILNLLIIVGGGLLLRILIPEDSFSERQINHGARLSIAALVYISSSTVEVAVVSVDLLSVVAAVLGLLCIGFVCTLGLLELFRLDSTVHSAVFFSGSLKNLGVALLLVDILSVPAGTGIVVTYYFCQQLSGAIAADVLFPEPALGHHVN